MTASIPVGPKLSRLSVLRWKLVGLLVGKQPYFANITMRNVEMTIGMEDGSVWIEGHTCHRDHLTNEPEVDILSPDE